MGVLIAFDYNLLFADGTCPMKFEIPDKRLFFVAVVGLVMGVVVVLDVAFEVVVLVLVILV